jgi:hypothetical protein
LTAHVKDNRLIIQHPTIQTPVKEDTIGKARAMRQGDFGVVRKSICAILIALSKEDEAFSSISFHFVTLARL